MAYRACCAAVIGRSEIIAFNSLLVSCVIGLSGLGVIVYFLLSSWG